MEHFSVYLYYEHFSVYSYYVTFFSVLILGICDYHVIYLHDYSYLSFID